MRAILLAALVSVAFSGAAMADIPAPDYGALPRDEASLRDLDNQQLRIVRRAGAQCWHSGEGGFRSNRSPQARVCIIGLADRAIADSGNAELQAYHQALPMNARYDEYRGAYYWQMFLAPH